MKKLFLITIILLSSLTMFSQSENFYGLATKFQVKNTGMSWPGWEETSSPMLIYLDTGFGFMSIANSYNDKFVLTSVKDIRAENGNAVFVFGAVDKERGSLTIEIVFFATENIAITVQYSNVSYSYWIDSNTLKLGYPFEYFEDDSGKKLLEMDTFSL